MTPISPSGAEAGISAVLYANANQKLLGFDALVIIVTMLLVHPAPRQMLRMIARQRPVEDLLAIPIAFGAACSVIREKNPGITQAELSARAATLMPILKTESHELDVAIRSEPKKLTKEDVTKMERLYEGFVEAVDMPGFSVAAHASSHPGLLSLMFDQYLMTLILITKVPADQRGIFLDGIWRLRVALFDCRNRKKKSA